MRRIHGFTQIELLVTLVVAAILISIGAPGFADLLRGMRASGDMNSLMSALSMARSEAVRHNRVVCLRSTNWAQQWQVTLSATNADTTCSAAGASQMRTMPGVSGTSTLTVTQGGVAVAAIAFSGAGRRVGAEYVIQYRSRGSGCDVRRDRDLRIGPSGRTEVDPCT